MREKTEKISKKRARELLARIAEFIELELTEISRDAKIDQRLFFSIGKAKYT